MDVWKADEGWNLESIETNLPRVLKERILAMPIHELEGRQTGVFMHSPTGELTCKGAYEFLQAKESSEEVGIPNGKWNWIWKIKCLLNFIFSYGFVCMDELTQEDLCIDGR